MFATSSLQGDFALVSSFDPALELPVIPDVNRETDSPEAIAEAERITAEVQRLYRVAAQTGNWHTITKPGEKPTFFWFRQIYGSDLQWLRGEVEYSSERKRRLTNDEGYELAFRLALTKIEGFPQFSMTQEPIGGRVLLTENSLMPLYAIGRNVGQPLLGQSIVLSLGATVWTRAVQGINPLS